jgi:O-antigen/teichoic acid export membrane protein
MFLPFYSLHFLVTSYWQGAKNFIKSGLFRFVFPYLLFFIGYLILRETEKVFLLYIIAFPALLFFEFFFVIRKVLIKNLPTISYKSLLRKSSSMMLSSIVIFSLNWSDILMIGILRGQEEVGNYQAAFKIASLSLLIIIVSNVVVAPKISEMFSQKKMAELFSFLRKVTLYTTIVTLVISIPFLFFSDLVMISLFGEAFKTTGPVLIVLSIANITSTFFGPIAKVMNMTKHQFAFKNITILTVMVNIVLNIILIEKYGALGCAISTLASIFILNIIGTLFIRKIYNRSLFTFSR